MSQAEIQWHISNIDRQIAEHEQNIAKLQSFPQCVYVEETMKRAAQRRKENLQAQLNN